MDRSPNPLDTAEFRGSQYIAVPRGRVMCAGCAISRGNSDCLRFRQQLRDSGYAYPCAYVVWVLDTPEGRATYWLNKE